MAEYYGKLKDYNDKGNPKILKKTVLIILLVVLILSFIAVFAGIFGDTKRRDETRGIIIENTELRQQVSELTEENEKLKKELDKLKKTLEQNSIQTGTPLQKPEGDMSDMADETEQN